jgi:RNA polymerase sigma-70 factor (ECF subfamily)
MIFLLSFLGDAIVKRFLCLCVPALLVLAGIANPADDLTLKTAKPVVIKTIPQAGADDVDPKLTEIKVTFSKDMADGGWSWCKDSDATFPKVTDKAHYEKDKRTCVLPVKLEAGKTYAIWVNTADFENFTDADGRSAVPYVLVFQTKKN